jgi:MinD superfamily P-loop ATPase
MKQLAVVSGKGGTGKTSVVASLAVLARCRAVIADCDVDAPDLHLILHPHIRERREFFGMKRAVIDPERCTKCLLCQDHCRFGAIRDLEIDPLACEGCGVCKLICPAQAVQMVDRLSGFAYISETRYGPLVHAELLPGEEASGKLVAMVREMARDRASSLGLDLVLIDGSPGIGCPVIASLSGVDLALVVTEPTISAEHDLERILGVTDHFGIRSCVCINKYDINPETARHIEELSRAQGIEIAARLPFDPAAVDAMVKGVPVVELDSSLSDSLYELWKGLEEQLQKSC